MSEKTPTKDHSSDAIILGEFSDRHPATLNLPTLLRSHLLLQAASGGGKSRALRRLCEQSFSRVPIVVIDPEGEFSSLRERYDFLLIGPGGETPADIRTASLLAHKLRELRVSAVCDLFEMEEEERHLWLRDFLMGMLNTPRSLWGNVLIMIDEAQLFAPEKGEEPSPAGRAMKKAAMLGRKRGMGLVIATNRIGITDKTVIAQCQNFVIGKTRLDIDQERSARAFGLHRKARDTFVEEIKRLSPGWFFAQGPAISDDRTLIHFGDVFTTHPEPGDTRHLAEPPPTPEEIRHLLPQLADLPREAEETRKVSSSSTTATTASHHRSAESPTVVERIVEKYVEVPLLDRTQMDSLENMAVSLRPLLAALTHRLDQVEAKMKSLSPPPPPPPPGTSNNNHPDGKTNPREPAVFHPVPHTTEPEPSQLESSPLEPLPSHPSSLIKVFDPEKNQYTRLILGERTILAHLTLRYPRGYTKAQLATLAGYNPHGGGYNNALGHLRKLGLIERDNENHVITNNGRTLFPHPPRPLSSEDILTLWCGKLTGRAKEMLHCLYQIRGTANPYMTVEALARHVKMDRHGGGFNNYMGDLRSNGLIMKGPGGYRISEMFLP